MTHLAVEKRVSASTQNQTLAALLFLYREVLLIDLVADSFYNLAFGITVFPASLIFGALWTNFNAETAFLVSASISICAAALLLTVKTKATN